ncbi:Phage Minor Tail Protein [Acetobacter pomorum DM001]|uniref:Phage Minor Tail Protein n=2 Tax=Acetobacter TaxID=434 RepID=F1YWE9_9PROT|nr:phage tail protein [Acetobacter sp. JWB]AXC27605.1 phage tail protein [Acetobacter sp. JWB]EGE46885.1 Phage Minor Tail Protein [Acetobacter pomorum DM001]
MAFFIEVNMDFTGATAGLAAGAQTNDTLVDFALETTYATPPTGNYQALRITGETLALQQTTARPSELNAQKQVSQAVITQVSASGTISGALSSGTFDDLIAGVMGNDWVNATVSGSSDSKTGYSYTLANGYTSGLPNIGGIDAASIATINNWPQNGYVYIHDPDNGIANFFQYQRTGAQGVIALQVKGALSPFLSANANGGPNARIFGPALTNGALDKTFTFRKKTLGSFLMYPGSLITQIQFQLQQAQFGTVSVDVTSANVQQNDNDVASAVLPAPSGKVHNSVNNFLGALINLQAPAGCVTQFTCTLARDGSKNEYGMGHADACGVQNGQFIASGSIEFYFRSWDEYKASIAGTQGPIVVTTVDDSGNGYAFLFTNAALRNPKVNSSQANATVTASFDIEGNPDASGGPAFAIYRLTGIPATGS